MLFIILAIGIVILATGIFVYKKWGLRLYREDNGWIYCSLNTVGVIVILISLGFILGIGAAYSNRIVIDQKIELYEQENKMIEDSITAAVNEYKDYEADIFKNMHTENAILIAGLYPDLKTNTLIQKQIETYTANRQQIKELEEEKLDYVIYRWWLFLKTED